MSRNAIGVGTLVLLGSLAAQAQVPFPPNWTNGPVGTARQNVYPYPGQCYTGAPIDGLPACDLSNAKSFACEPSGSGRSNQSAASAVCNVVSSARVVNPIAPGSQAKFQFEVLNPPDYTPDTTTYPGVDYYEIGFHESWGFQAIADAGLFPNATQYGVAGGAPNGTQWTGLRCPANAGALGLTCKAGMPLFTPIWGVGQINQGGGPVTSVLTSLGLFAPPTGRQPSWSANNYIATWPSISIRGTTGRPVRVKWVNEFPNNHLFCPHPEAADWACSIDRTFMGVKATIDPQKAPPTFNASTGVRAYAVNQFGGAQQPDNSWVTHLHGGEIQPSVDGFAEKWFGNRQTGALYSPSPFPLNPAFGAPYSALASGSIADQLLRPGGNTGGDSSYYYDTYTYPMVNEESTIWFHDHTLGKTHHNVIAGPAGFFPVRDPSKHNPIVNGVCTKPGLPPVACEYTWLDPVTEPRDSLGIPKYDLFLAIQDRTFSDDGTINFSNGIGQQPVAPAVPGSAAYPACLAVVDANGLPAPTCSAPGSSPWTPGPNPQVHPTWVPEYFGDHVLVNGVLWPKRTVSPGWYRIRLVDGSDARCYTIGFGTVEPGYATGTAAAATPIRNVPFYVIATEQGYLSGPALNKGQATKQTVTMCPGERYELLINFGGSSLAYTDPVTGRKMPAAPLAGQVVYMNNTAAAPYPAGVTPQQPGSPFAHVASIMRFDVLGAKDPVTLASIPAVPSCPTGQGATWPGDATYPQKSCIALPTNIDYDFISIAGLKDCPKDGRGKPITTGGPCVAAERQLFLNEKGDPITLASVGLQINGVPFEYDVTETPQVGTYERWKIINATVDAHPIHPHLVKAQIVSRQSFAKGKWLTQLCGSAACEPGPAMGGVPMLVPDVTPFLTGTPRAPDPEEAGWKDAMRALPGEVLTFIAKWDGSWPGAHGECSPDNKSCFEPVTAGPYVWHCHINSHEDSEMMRTSLVVKP